MYLLLSMMYYVFGKLHQFKSFFIHFLQYSSSVITCRDICELIQFNQARNQSL